MRIWVAYGLVAVLGKTAFYTLQKRGLGEHSSVSMALASTVLGGPVLGLLAAHRYATDPGVAAVADLRVVAVIGGLEVGSFLLGLYVLSKLDLSLLTPLQQTKPVVVALVEPVVLAAAFEPVVGAAAAVATVGGAVASYESGSEELLAPSRRELALVGLVIAVYTALSLGARFGATRMPVVVFGGVVYGILFAAYLGLFVGRHARSGRGGLPTPARAVLDPVVAGVAVLGPIRSVAVWLAYGSAPSAASVTVLTQLTVVLQVVIGGVALGEGNTPQRLVGGLLIVSGVVLLTVT